MREVRINPCWEIDSNLMVFGIDAHTLIEDFCCLLI
jgi:hypothetical protein